MLIRLNTLGRGSLIREFFSCVALRLREHKITKKKEILLKFALLAPDVNGTKAQRHFS